MLAQRIGSCTWYGTLMLLWRQVYAGQIPWLQERITPKIPYFLCHLRPDEELRDAKRESSICLTLSLWPHLYQPSDIKMYIRLALVRGSSNILSGSGSLLTLQPLLSLHQGHKHPPTHLMPHLLLMSTVSGSLPHELIHFSWTNFGSSTECQAPSSMY